MKYHIRVVRVARASVPSMPSEPFEPGRVGQQTQVVARGRVLVECQRVKTMPIEGQEMTFTGYEGGPPLDGDIFVVQRVRHHFKAADPSEDAVVRRPMVATEEEQPFIDATVFVDYAPEMLW